MKIYNIIIHHSGGTDLNPLQDSSNYTVKQCDSDHKARFNMKSTLGWYVGYHYFIDKKGVITQTRKDSEEGAHTIGYNNGSSNPKKASIGICMSGNFDATMPTDAQINSLTTLLNNKVKEYDIDPKNIFPHRAFAKKTCYGNKLSEDWARNLIKKETIIKQCKLGDTGENIKEIQAILKKGKYTPCPLTEGVYDISMAQATLYFQIVNGVQKVVDVAILRGEKIGPSTLQALINLK